MDPETEESIDVNHLQKDECEGMTESTTEQVQISSDNEADVKCQGTTASTTEQIQKSSADKERQAQSANTDTSSTEQVQTSSDIEAEVQCQGTTASTTEQIQKSSADKERQAQSANTDTSSTEQVQISSDIEAEVQCQGMTASTMEQIQTSSDIEAEVQCQGTTASTTEQIQTSSDNEAEVQCQGTIASTTEQIQTSSDIAAEAQCDKNTDLEMNTADLGHNQNNVQKSDLIADESKEIDDQVIVKIDDNTLDENESKGTVSPSSSHVKQIQTKGVCRISMRRSRQIEEKLKEPSTKKNRASNSINNHSEIEDSGEKQIEMVTTTPKRKRGRPKKSVNTQKKFPPDTKEDSDTRVVTAKDEAIKTNEVAKRDVMATNEASSTEQQPIKRSVGRPRKRKQTDSADKEVAAITQALTSRPRRQAPPPKRYSPTLFTTSPKKSLSKERQSGSISVIICKARTT